jgi:hypothetical protein
MLNFTPLLTTHQNIEGKSFPSLNLQNPKSEIRNPKSEIRNPKSKINILKSKTMATSTSNILTRGFSGKLGGLVFRNCKDKTIIAQAPRKRSKPLSQKQKMQRIRFKVASQYAKKVIANPEASAVYARRLKPGKSIYMLAMADHLRYENELFSPE